MTTFKGMDGLLALGGYLLGTTIAVNGAVAEGGTTVAIDGSPLTGVVQPGDHFTVTGVAGTYTVTNATPLVATTNAIAGITFTPAAPSGGFPNDSPFLLTSTSLAQLRQWQLTEALSILDATVMRQAWQTFRAGVASWNGRAQALFDRGDTVQAALLDHIASGTPNGVVSALFFGVYSPQAKGFYGSAVLSGWSVEASQTDLVTAQFTFQGSTFVSAIWQ